MTLNGQFATTAINSILVTLNILVWGALLSSILSKVIELCPLLGSIEYTETGELSCVYRCADGHLFDTPPNKMGECDRLARRQ
jgi:hypothetical protein